MIFKLTHTHRHTPNGWNAPKCYTPDSPPCVVARWCEGHIPLLNSLDKAYLVGYTIQYFVVDLTQLVLAHQGDLKLHRSVSGAVFFLKKNKKLWLWQRTSHFGCKKNYYRKQCIWLDHCIAMVRSLHYWRKILCMEDKISSSIFPIDRENYFLNVILLTPLHVWW